VVSARGAMTPPAASGAPPAHADLMVVDDAPARGDAAAFTGAHSSDGSADGQHMPAEPHAPGDSAACDGEAPARDDGAASAGEHASPRGRVAAAAAEMARHICTVGAGLAQRKPSWGPPVPEAAAAAAVQAVLAQDVPVERATWRDVMLDLKLRCAPAGAQGTTYWDVLMCAVLTAVAAVLQCAPGLPSSGMCMGITRRLERYAEAPRSAAAHAGVAAHERAGSALSLPLGVPPSALHGAHDSLFDLLMGDGAPAPSFAAPAHDGSGDEPPAGAHAG
jgi:hypothetical protein